jgi:hypothetical protein
MILAMIINGSILSLVYPVSIFIYALLEEKRPHSKYWMVIIYYTSVVVVLKFLMQTYPISDWLISDFVVANTATSTVAPDINSINDWLRTFRVGLENIDDSGTDFVEYFLFEAFILLSVTLHMFILIFGGVWTTRETEAESIDQAAVRITRVQFQKRLEKSGNASILSESMIDDEDEVLQYLDQHVCPPDYYKLRRRRAFSMNDCTRLLEVAEELDNMSERNESIDAEQLEDWREYEANFAYGGEKYSDHDEMDFTDYPAKEMKRNTYMKYVKDNKGIRKMIGDNWVQVYTDEQIPVDFNKAMRLKTSERSMTQYPYRVGDLSELKNDIIKKKAGKNIFKEFFLKVKTFLTHSYYFETLFPTIKEQKPGFDLYAPMALVQVVTIIFIIFFYTRMDPDYTNITDGDLTPTSFSGIMVVAVFFQIFVIVLDRYLYLSRDYIIIDEVDIEDELEESDDALERTESISQFDRKKTFDLRSSSGASLLVGSITKNKQKLKGVSKENKNLDEMEDEDENGEEVEKEQGAVSLSKTSFNKTLVIKYYLQLFLIVVIHIITFWYFPIKANIDLQSTGFCQYRETTASSCNEVSKNWTLVVFYLLYCLYFIISGLQIRYGLPELRKGNFAMGDYTPINKGVFQGFLAAPFVLELKIVSDWTFTRTALDLFQWIKFENIYSDLFIAKCTNKGYLAHPLGEPIPLWSKALIGCGGLFGLIFVIAGPLLLFSSFNPLADDNLVTGASIQVLLKANLTDTEGGPTSQFELFRTTRYSDISLISDANYDRISSTRVVRNLQRDLFQQVELSSVSDNTWAISPPSQADIFDIVDRAEIDQGLGINIVLIYNFERPEPAGQQIIDKELPIINILKSGVTGAKKILETLRRALDPARACTPDEVIQ